MTAGMSISSPLRAQLGYYGGLGRELYLIMLAGSSWSFFWGLNSVLPGVYLPTVGLGGEAVVPFTRSRA